MDQLQAAVWLAETGVKYACHTACHTENKVKNGVSRDIYLWSDALFTRSSG